MEEPVYHRPLQTWTSDKTTSQVLKEPPDQKGTASQTSWITPCWRGKPRKMWALRLNPSSVCTWQNKTHIRNILVPQRAAKKKIFNFQPFCPTVKCTELPWELSVWIKMYCVCLGRTRLLGHLSAKLQRYHGACMKCNISASINGWHLHGCNMETLTLGIAFCKVLSPSSRTEGRDCSGLKKNKKPHTSDSQNYFHPTCFSEMLFLHQDEAHAKTRKIMHKLSTSQAYFHLTSVPNKQ